jgi:uncharacterized protein (DUF3820 family)
MSGEAPVVAREWVADGCLAFGEHKGVLLADVPDTYLKWVIRTFEEDAWQKPTGSPERLALLECVKLVRAERHRRKHEGVAAMDLGE